MFRKERNPSEDHNCVYKYPHFVGLCTKKKTQRISIAVGGTYTDASSVTVSAYWVIVIQTAWEMWMLHTKGRTKSPFTHFDR